MGGHVNNYCYKNGKKIQHNLFTWLEVYKQLFHEKQQIIGKCLQACTKDGIRALKISGLDCIIVLTMVYSIPTYNMYTLHNVQPFLESQISLS